MANCKKCPFYDEKYDRMKSSLVDVIIEGEEYEEHHFCIMHNDHIDDYFVHGKKCEHEVQTKHP